MLYGWGAQEGGSGLGEEAVQVQTPASGGSRDRTVRADQPVKHPPNGDKAVLLISHLPPSSLLRPFIPSY